MEIGRRDNGGRKTLSQINVTPFVDVMLVLLIIFMVTAPMLDQGVEVNLPEVADAPALERNQQPLVVTVTRDGALLLGRNRLDGPAKLSRVLQQMVKDKRLDEVFLEADREVPYGRVVEVMAAIKGAGVSKLGMVSQPPES